MRAEVSRVASQPALPLLVLARRYLSNSSVPRRLAWALAHHSSLKLIAKTLILTKAPATLKKCYILSSLGNREQSTRDTCIKLKVPNSYN
jgi:hypothetical protein